MSKKEAVIELEGNPTTGFTWFYTIGDESIISIEGQVKYLGKREIKGAPSLFKYTVTGLKTGETEIKFEYKRGWETKPPIEELFYKVTVDGSGKVKLVEVK